MLLTRAACFAFISPMSSASPHPLPQRPSSLRDAATSAPPAGSSLSLEMPRRAASAVLGGLARAFLHERELYCVDGANVFDPYAFSQAARVRGLSGERILDRVFVTRTFTIHQLQAVVEEMLPPRGGEASGPVVAMLGLDHLFREETLRAAERGRVLAAVMARLRGLERTDTRLLVTYERPPPRERFWRPMLEFGTVRSAVRPGTAKGEFTIEGYGNGTDSTDIQHLLAGGDRLLEALPPGAEGGAEDGLRPPVHQGAPAHGRGGERSPPDSIRCGADGDPP